MLFLANCQFQTDKMRIADKKSEQMKVRVIVEEKDHQLADKTRTDNKDEANKRDRNNKMVQRDRTIHINKYLQDGSTMQIVDSFFFI